MARGWHLLAYLRGPLRSFTVHEYQPGQVIRIGDCTITLHGLRHVVANCGIRIQSGLDTMAHTGDTGPVGALAELARDAGLLLAEATLADPDAGDWATGASPTPPGWP